MHIKTNSWHQVDFWQLILQFCSILTGRLFFHSIQFNSTQLCLSCIHIWTQNTHRFGFQDQIKCEMCKHCGTLKVFVVARDKRKQSHLYYVEANSSTHILNSNSIQIRGWKKKSGRKIQSKNGFHTGMRREIEI